MSDPIESAITSEHSRQEHALAAALDQIDVAFGREESLTPEQRLRRARIRFDKVSEIRDGVVRLARADAQKDRDEQGWTPIDSTIAYAVSWFLRKEADSDNVISEDGKASAALEEAAAHIESGEILACPQEMLADVESELDALREKIAAIVDTLPQGHDRETGRGAEQG